MEDRTIQQQINEAQFPICVRASAGTGKTYCLTEKIKHCIDQGINPINILAFTFTVDAANDLKQRIPNGELMTIGTIHSVMLQVIREHSKKRYYVIDNGYQRKVVFDIFKEFSIDFDKYNNYMSAIGMAKNTFPDYYELLENHDPTLGIYFNSEKLYSFAEEYERKKEHSHKIDFDDMCLKALALLKENAFVLDNRQERWKYIFVDEAQDLCPPQIEVIKLLAQKYRNLFIVGDEKQAIYGSFRASTPDFIRYFEDYYRDARMFSLPTTYRCPISVTQAGNKIANLIDKSIINTANTNEGIINKIPDFNSQTEEAQAICDTAIEIFRKTDKTIKILYRTNAQSLMYQFFLLQNNIPYSINQTNSIFNSKEAKTAFACCDFAYKFKQMSPVDKMSCLNDMRPIFANRKQLYSLNQVYKSEQEPQQGYYKYSEILYEIEALYNHLQAYNKPSEIVLLISKNESLNDMNSSTEDNLTGIAEFIKNCNNMEEVQALIREFSKPRDIPKTERVIALSTIHGSKGLEADIIFLTGVSDDILPHKFGIQEEELNLFYVGVTRAKEMLYVTGFKTFGTKSFEKHTYMEII